MTKLKEIRQEIESMLIQIYSNIGCDRPENHDDILNYIIRDVIETADLECWHSGDVVIAFRRWMEEQSFEIVTDHQIKTTLEETLDRLQEEADELINCGNSHEKGQGHAIMGVLKEIRKTM